MDDTTLSFQYGPWDSNGTSRDSRTGDQNCAYPDAQGEPLEMIKQLQTHTVTEEQLVDEVRGTYASLVIVEQKCIKSNKHLAQSNAELSPSQRQALVLLHRTLLYQHLDFFVASQHPSASLILRGLASKYEMPGRMWRYGIQSLLELLRQRTPDSMEHMLYFFYLSYSIVTLLLERVPGFRLTWMECLGDLARYRMAVEEVDKRDRELWAGVSRYWYNQDADQSAESGRIQHHLGVLARPNILQQFFHYTKALVSVHAFPDAFDSMIQLISPLMNVPAQKRGLTTSFVTAHGALLIQAPDFDSRANAFLATLRNEISEVGRQGQQGVQLVSCNISAIFQYGSKHGVMKTDFTLKLRNSTAEDRLAAMGWAYNASSGAIYTAHSDPPSQLVFRASSLAFHTLIVMLGQVHDPNMYPSVHISIAFVWCLTLNPAAIQRLEPLIPWALLANYLNTLFDPSTITSKIEDDSFPSFGDLPMQQLPEDFLIRGQAWSRVYFPEGFFEGAPTEDDRPSTEGYLTEIARRHRCLWIGVRIATFTRWMTYDRTRHFTPTGLADEFAQMAQSSTYLCDPVAETLSWSGGYSDSGSVPSSVLSSSPSANQLGKATPREI